LGKEWRKTLHPDVQIIGGGDISLGGGAAADNEIVIAGHEKGEEIRWNEVNNGAILSASIAPFTGIRISWGRLVLGYSASLPIDLVLLKQRNISLIGLETNFSHDISFGYRFGKGNKSK